MKEDLFTWVKDNVTISEYVERLPECNGLSAEGGGRFRTNNVIDGGSDNTAMVIDDNQGFFKCWNKNHSAGDVISLFKLMSPADISMKEAAIGVCNFMGVTIPESLLSKGSGVSKTDIKKFLRSLTDLLVENRKKSELVSEYFDERGITTDVADKWQLGLFPESQEKCKKIVAKALGKSSHKIAEASGVVNNRGFVSMMGRLSFPVMNRAGDVIGFSSRVVPGIDSFSPDSKYINTKNTSVYDKSSTLYGEHLVGHDAKQRIYVCEGNFDVIAINEVLQNGEVAVAVCGTSLTEGHSQTLSSTKNIVIAFDDDVAGRSATRSAAWLMNQAKLSVLQLHDGADPWDWYSSDIDGFSKAINGKKSNYEATVIETGVSDLDKNDFLHWAKQVYSRQSMLDVREGFKRSLKELSGFSDSAIEEALSGLERVTTKDTAIGVPLNTSVAITALLWLTSNEKSALLGDFGTSKSDFSDFVSSWVASSDDSIDMIGAAMFGLDWGSDRSTLNAVQMFYPESDDEGEEALRAFVKSIFGRLIFTVESNSELLSNSPILAIMISRINAAICSGMVSKDSRAALRFATETIESINYESKLAEKRKNKEKEKV